MPTTTDPPPDPKRFEVSKPTLLVDSFMNNFIRIGGIGIIGAIFCIFLFILIQILPLFQNAKVQEGIVIQTGLENFDTAGIDEWGELPFLATKDGVFRFYNTLNKEGEKPSNSPVLELNAGFEEGETYDIVHYNPGTSTAIFGGQEGRCRMVKIQYKANFDDQQGRTIEASLESGAPFQIGKAGAPILAFDFYDVPGERIVAAIQKGEEGNELNILRFKAKKALFGSGKLQREKEYALTGELDAEPQSVLVNGLGTAILVGDKEGKFHYFAKSGAEITHAQTFVPFTESEGTLGKMNWLLGKISVVVTSSKGHVRILSMSLNEKTEELQYHTLQDVRKLEGPSSFFSASLRNRAFLHGEGKKAFLEYATTGKTRWETELPVEPQIAFIGPKYDRMGFVGKDASLHLYMLDDPHPESGLRAFFGKVWYEGQPQPKYLWQSTGSGSSFEPKLSMIPLLAGSFKGTFYALIFAVPIAVLAAAYTSQFLQPSLAKIVKPTMEIMASLPSVVLGFLAALWLAPILETKIPSILSVLILVPLVTYIAGWAWSQLPTEKRNLIKPGREIWGLLPLLFVTTWIGWQLGPTLEGLLFTVTDPVTGKTVADFRTWWPEATGLPFEQRNSVVAGFAMGFAVIPIIFTISEDAMSNVPTYLRSASYALGASRWQTAWRVALPTASAGIFSAIMIGLGRAVGETMILVMATGNTPLMDLNPFSGMRTLSANIAVELPEAPHHSTLYRSLFLGAMLLFILTFAINTVAEITRQKLRERFKTVG